MQDVQDELSIMHGKLAQFKTSLLLMLSQYVDSLEDLKEQAKSLIMSYSGIEDLAEERHSAYMLRLEKSVESLIVDAQPVPVTVDVNHARIVAQIKMASEQHDISTIVALMKSHASASTVQQKACQLLAGLALNGVYQVSIANAGGILTTVNIMGAHLVHAGVQEQGCSALANLAANAAKKVAIADLGGIAAIVSGMEAHRAHAGVQEQGCVALTNLAVNAANQVSISKAGGITAISLANLALNAANQVSIADLGGITTIVSGLESHLNDACVQYQGCAALGNLATNNAENKVSIADAGGIAVVVSGMKAHRDHAGVQEIGCWTLATHDFNNIESKVLIAKTGGITTIVKGMKAHRSQANVQKYGCQALSALLLSVTMTTAWRLLRRERHCRHYEWYGIAC